MKNLPHPDNKHLEAAEGWLELGNYLEENRHQRSDAAWQSFKSDDWHQQPQHAALIKFQGKILVTDAGFDSVWRDEKVQRVYRVFRRDCSDSWGSFYFLASRSTTAECDSIYLTICIQFIESKGI